MRAGDGRRSACSPDDDLPSIPIRFPILRRDPRAWSAILAIPLAVSLGAVEPPDPEAVEAFRSYAARAVEEFAARAEAEAGMPLLDRLEPEDRSEARERLDGGEVVLHRIEPVGADGQELDLPGAVLYHWAGAVFVPGLTVEQVLSVTRDYDAHDEIYDPEIRRSRVLSREDGRSRVFHRLRKEKLITVTLDVVEEIEHHRPAPARAYSISRAVRIREVADAGEEGERELSPEEAGGYLWGLRSLWRYLEGDGGSYVEAQTLTLSRRRSFVIRLFASPSDVPRDSLEFLLRSTREAALQRFGAPGSDGSRASHPGPHRARRPPAGRVGVTDRRRAGPGGCRRERNRR